jgi:GPH family glycoside/pentoside/hexuronide:cation symporter
MGMVVDRTKSKHGKARPYLLWLAIPFAIAAVLLFTVPDISDTGIIIYIFFTYNIAILIYTAIEIPHGSLNALITHDQHVRSELNVTRMIGAYVAILAISNFTVPIVEFFGGGQQGWIYTFIVFGIVAAIIYFITFATTKERTSPSTSEQKQEKKPILQSVKALFRNKYWFIITLVFMLMYIYNGLSSGAAIYYADYILGNSAIVGLVITAASLMTLLGMFLVVPITKKYGKRNTAIVGCFIAIVGSLIFFIDPSSLTVVIIGQVIRGFGKAAVMGVLFAMLADTVEYGEWKTGVRDEGLVYSGASMGIKIGTGFGSAFIGWGLALGGYVGGQAVQPDSALFMINVLFIYLPIIISILMIVLLLLFKLDKEYPQILRELKERNSTV